MIQCVKPLLSGHLGDLPKCLLNVCFQKISIPHPRKIIGNSEGEGGFKGSNFRGVWGVHGKLFSKGWQTMYKTLKATYDRSEAQKHTYVRCFETKLGTPGHWHEVNIISFNVSVFLWVASTTIFRRTMCLWTKSKTIENGGHNWSLVFVSFSPDQH